MTNTVLAFRTFLTDQKNRRNARNRATTSKNKGFTAGVSPAGCVTRETPPHVAPESLSDEIRERQAIAEILGGVPPLYSLDFARLQVIPPDGMTRERWQQAIDDAGRFLDMFGEQAVTLDWCSLDVFGPQGIVWGLQGDLVVTLTRRAAILADGRVLPRPS